MIYIYIYIERERERGYSPWVLGRYVLCKGAGVPVARCNRCKGGIQEYVLQAPAPARPILSHSFMISELKKACVGKFVCEPGGNEAIFKDHLQDSFDRAASTSSFEKRLRHCINFLVDRLQQRQRRFYIGITHCPLHRWTNDEFGHKWDKRRCFKVMHVLLKCRGFDCTRPVEKALAEMIYEGAIKLATGYPASQLIHNEKNTPTGALVNGPDGEHYLYWCE